MDFAIRLFAFLIPLFVFKPVCLAQQTQFSDEAIDKRIEKIKADIISKQKFNVKILGGTSAGHAAIGNDAFDRAYIEERNRDSNPICSEYGVMDLLSDAVQQYCVPDDLFKRCKEFQEKAQQHAQTLFRQMTSIDGGMETTLQKYHDALQSALRTTINYNDMCSSEIITKLFSDDCSKAYDKVLTQGLTEQLSHQCSTASIDQTIREFKGAMRNIYVKKIDDIRDTHIKSRELEGELALKISEIRAQIQKLRNAEPVRTAELRN